MVKVIICVSKIDKNGEVKVKRRYIVSNTDATNDIILKNSSLFLTGVSKNPLVDQPLTDFKEFVIVN